jgi:hypothetical protein
MINDLKKESKWNLIVIDDPTFLSGETFFNLIHLILEVVNFKFTILDYIDGSKVSPLIEKENDIIKVEDLLEILPSVQQFDWGDFFFFENYPTNWDNSKKELYPYVICQTSTTLRAVDSQYIYIYTPSLQIMNLIKENYNIESVKIGLLNELDYPE